MTAPQNQQAQQPDARERQRMALVAARNGILDTVEKYSDQIARLAPRGANPEHYLASLRLYLAQNPKLLECTPASIALGILRVAQTGLELGQSCDLLPFKKSCVFSPRYNGIIELALASGTRAINADVVRLGDRFDYAKGTKFFLDHKAAPEKDRGEIICAYAIAEIKSGSFAFEVLSREEIDKVRMRYSKSWKEGSLDDIPWYAKKRCIRALSQYLPKNPRLAAALAATDEAEEPLVDIPEGHFEIQGTDPASEPKEGPPAAQPALNAGEAPLPEQPIAQREAIDAFQDDTDLMSDEERLELEARLA